MIAKRTAAVAAEFRTAPELGEGVAEAYVALWDTVYSIGRGTREQIDRRAFEDAADGQKTFPIYLEHQWDAGPIGHQTFRADGKGLRATQTYYLDDPRARNVFRALKAGAYNQHSIGFLPGDIETEQRSDYQLERVMSGDLVESSVVARGANGDTTTVDVRAVVPGMPAPAGAPAPAIDPATGLPVEDTGEEATKADLLAEVARVVQMAVDTDMLEQLPKLIKTYSDMLAPEPTPVAVDPNAPVAPAPVAPRALPEDLSPSLFRALSA